MTYPAIEQYGLIWTCLSKKPARNLPDWPELADPAFTKVHLVESQHPEELPLDLSEEFHIRGDQMSTAYRKALVALGLGREYSS
jgi:vanillate O-demethylase monooxygenase subunit